MRKVLWLENVKGGVHLEDLGIDGRIILERNNVGSCGLDSYGSGEGPVVDCCEHGNEPSGSI
jgi:hypothetical protein